MITTEFKERIVTAIKENRKNFPSDSKQAVSLGINGAQLSRINKNDFEGVLSDAKWVTIARRLNVNRRNETPWQIAETPVFMFISAQLKACQERSISSILCDVADIGKSCTAKHYAKMNKNAIYIDCSQVKSKQLLIRQIAKEFGVHHTGRYAEVYADLIYYLKSIDNPLIILDEAGDLAYPAFLELKALWNATEGYCGWYMMGADGLQKKIDDNKDRRKVGYTEIFSRFGSKYQKATPNGSDDFKAFVKHQTVMVGKVNGAKDLQKLYAKTMGSLRRVRIEISKQNG